MAKNARAASTHVAPLEASWGGGVSPFGATWQKTMMWIFIVTDALLFSGLLSGYGFLRQAAGVWPHQSEVFSIPFIALMRVIMGYSIPPLTISSPSTAVMWDQG